MLWRGIGRVRCNSAEVSWGVEGRGGPCANQVEIAFLPAVSDAIDRAAATRVPASRGTSSKKACRHQFYAFDIIL
jgi:hypothetical protein